MHMIAMMACRNEDWVLGTSVRVALEWCDSIVILDHASTDDSAAIIEDLKQEHGSRIIRLWTSDSSWDEMEHRQKMLDAARSEGATHLAIVDADEILTANCWKHVRAMADMMRAGQLIQLPGYNLRGSIDRYHANGIWGNRWFSTIFMDNPRLGWHGDRFHHREPMGVPLSPYRPLMQGQGGIMHLWGADERRLKAKHALYKMTETLRWPDKRRSEINKLYSLAFYPSLDLRFDQTWRYADVPADWWAHREHLRVDGEPWQESECRKLWQEHGATRFAGLNLFGVCEDA